MAISSSFSVGQVLTAADMNSLPWGLVATTAGGTNSLAYKSITTATVNTQVAGIVDVTDASMTFTGISGRLYCVSIFGFAASTSSAGVCAFYITNGSNTQLQYQYEEFSANGYGQVSMRYIFTQTGSGTIKMRMDSLVAQTTVFGAVPAVGTMTIEDIGPAS